MAHVTRIENAAWAVLWDQVAGRQVYARDVDLVFCDDSITHIGPGWAGPVDAVIDGRERLLIPGLINLHSHPQSEPASKGIREEHGVPAQFMTGLYERSLAFRLDEAGRRAGAELAYADLLASGVTTLVELSAPLDGWLDLLAQSGLRAVVGPGFQSARWRLENDWELGFAWDPPAGRRGFEVAQRIIEEADAHPSGCLSGIVFPAQIETCEEALFRDAFAFAEASGRPFTTHISQSVVEFREIVRRHGKTPVQFAADLGVLAPRSILGHVASRDIHSATTGDLFEMATVGGARALARDDLGRLAVGAKADLVLVDLAEPAMRPLRDPLKSLIYHAADRAVRDVFVDGRHVLADGQPLGLDRHDAAARLEEAQARMIEKVPELDYAGRTAAEIAPLSLPLASP